MALRDPNPNKTPKVVTEPTELPEPDVGSIDPDLVDFADDDMFVADDEEVGSIDDSGEEDPDESELQRFECLQHDAIINGHRLSHGHVVEMTMHDVRKHRRQGVAISDPLPDDDKREVSVDVTKPFQPAQDGDAEPVGE